VILQLCMGLVSGVPQQCSKSTSSITSQYCGCGVLQPVIHGLAASWVTRVLQSLHLVLFAAACGSVGAIMIDCEIDCETVDCESGPQVTASGTERCLQAGRQTVRVYGVSRLKHSAHLYAFDVARPLVAGRRLVQAFVAR